MIAANHLCFAPSNPVLRAAAFGSAVLAIAALSGGTLAVTSAPAEAGTITYQIDQPLWGRAPVGQNSIAWQNNQAGFVAGNPDFHARLTGQVSVDWDTGTYSAVQMRYVIPHDGARVDLLFGLDDIVSAGMNTNTNSGIRWFSFVMSTRLGEDRTFDVHPSIDPSTVDVTLPRYRGSLSLALYNDPPDGDIRMLIQNMRLSEARQALTFGAFETGGSPAGGEYVQVAQRADTQTCCCNYGVSLVPTAVLPPPDGGGATDGGLTPGDGGGTTPGGQVGVVPLPAAGWLLLTALAGVGLLGRRRRAA